MDFAYSYKARNASEYTSGIIVAGSLNRAYYQAKLLKVQATSVQLDPVATVRLLIGGQTGAKSELSLFYRSLAGRLDSGDHTGIHVVFQDALGYVSDVRLRQQIQFAGLALASSGSPLPEAMRLAGFPQRDCTVLAATQAAGAEAKTLEALAAQLEREAHAETELNKVLMMPVAMIGLFVIVALTSIFYIYPGFYKLAQQTNALTKMTPVVRDLYEVSGRLAAIPSVPLVAGAVLLALTVYAWKAGWMIKVSAVLPAARKLSANVDQIRTWGAWISMDAANLPAHQAFSMLSEGAAQPHTRKMLATAAAVSARGTELAKAVELAQFPPMIVRHIKAAPVGKVATYMTHLIRALELQNEQHAQAIKMFYTYAGLALAGALAFVIGSTTVLEFLRIATAVMNR